MTTKPINVEANILRSGAVVISYSVGRVYGAVMFDKNGRYSDATRQTGFSTGRGFCEMDQLPSGVLAAARAARRAVVEAA